MRELKSLVECLPGPPQWQATEVTILGGTTQRPITFLFRDGLECFKHLFSNPMFASDMDYRPRKLWTDESKASRVYTEIMTGDFAWDVQVRPLPFCR